MSPHRKAVLFVAILASLTAASRVRPQTPPVQDDELHRGKGYPGAQYFFRLPHATVIYPAGEGQDAPRNLRSALARAAYLRERSGMEVRVVADVEATDADRKDNLLLLGWDNALLGSPGPVRPYERTADGIRFLGIEHLDPEGDLLFFSRSPFDPDRFVLFWSRIDPERDRFAVLPWVGSDWALYEEFLPVRQGMFLPGTTWPPRRDERAQADHQPALLEERGRLKITRTEHYDIFAIPSEFPPDDLERIGATREKALAEATAALSPPPAGFRVALFLYPDVENKKRRTGVPDPTHSAPWAGELHMIRAVALSPSPHEDTHLLARALFGPCENSAIYEGLAIAVENRARGVPLEAAGAVLFDSGSFPPLADLLDEQRFAGMSETVGPVAAGMLVTWLRATSPPERFAAAYRLHRGDPQSLAAALGRDPDTLDSSFRAWLRERTDARSADIRFQRAEAKAQDAYIIGDWREMVAALREALQHRPDDRQTLFNLASAEMRAEELGGAEATLRRLLALPEEAGSSRFRVFGHYQLGRVLDLQGRREEALEEYRRVLALPDESGAHLLAEERILKPATREDLD